MIVCNPPFLGKTRVLIRNRDSSTLPERQRKYELRQQELDKRRDKRLSEINRLLKETDELTATVLNLTPGIRGVYILYDDKEVVYVGRSSNIISRVGNHTRNKEYDTVKYIAIDNIELIGIVESIYVAMLRPKYNMINADLDRMYDRMSLYEQIDEDTKSYFRSLL